MGTPRTIQEARANFIAAAPLVAERYRNGVNRADWESAASSQQAEANYSQGVQRAIQRGTRIQGIQRAGNQTWRNGATQKGAPVIGQRMQEAADKYVQNFTPIKQAIDNAVAQLPPRTLDPSQNVQNRVLPVVMAAFNASPKNQ